MKSLFTKITCLNLVVCLSLLFGGSALGGTWSGQILGTGEMINIYGSTNAGNGLATGKSSADKAIDWIRVDVTAYNSTGVCNSGYDERTNDTVAAKTVGCSNGTWAESEHLWSNWGEIKTATTNDWF
jgi:hypothetical protein